MQTPGRSLAIAQGFVITAQDSQASAKIGSAHYPLSITSYLGVAMAATLIQSCDRIVLHNIAATEELELEIRSLG